MRSVASISLLVVACGFLPAGKPGPHATFAHPDEVDGVAFFPDGKSVATACTDKKLRVWDLATGKVAKTFEHRDEIWSVAVSADGKTVVSGNWDSTATIWDVASGK